MYQNLRFTRADQEPLHQEHQRQQRFDWQHNPWPEPPGPHPDLYIGIAIGLIPTLLQSVMWAAEWLWEVVR